MTYTEKKVLNYIKRWHAGRRCASTYKKISASLGMEARDFRSVVAHLVTEHGALIATTSDLGYYYIENLEDYNHARAEILSRIKKLRARLDGLDAGWEKKIGPQRTLFEVEV